MPNGLASDLAPPPDLPCNTLIQLARAQPTKAKLKALIEFDNEVQELTADAREWSAALMRSKVKSAAKEGKLLKDEPALWLQRRRIGMDKVRKYWDLKCPEIHATYEEVLAKAVAFAEDFEAGERRVWKSISEEIPYRESEIVLSLQTAVYHLGNAVKAFQPGTVATRLPYLQDFVTK
jgi:hypothetical protein